MNFTEEQLEEIESMAGLFFSITEIMVCLEIPSHQEEEFKNVLLYHSQEPLYRAYHKGRITAEIELRQSIKSAALNGSNPAQNTMLQFYTQSRL